jgi:hypothetical protein
MGLDRVVIKLRNRGIKLDADQLKKAKPERNPIVEAEVQSDGSLVLSAPLEATGKKTAGLMARWMKMPATRKFELDPFGTLVWEHCDGQHTVEAISKALRNRYKMNRAEADVALGAFLQTLSQRGLITLMVAKK